MTIPGEKRSTDFKALYRKLEQALDRIERLENVSDLLAQILKSLVRDFRDELGFERGRLYERQDGAFFVRHAYGYTDHIPIGYRMPENYPPHLRTLSEGILIMRAGDPGFDAEIERAVGVSSTFAAIAVGEGHPYVLAFSIKGEIHEERILYSLTAVRHVVNLKLTQQRLTGILEESRIIQESLLPQAPPDFPGYDIAGKSRPTDSVGGDLYDYLWLTDDLLGIAIGDASGHGLPAALVARDVVTGLRMGMDQNLKVVPVIERLNKVIHRAALSSKFISLFYGELAQNGAFLYCNAGHNPPYLLKGGELIPLELGGLVLGPNPAARYERGHVHMDPGDSLFLYTDGVPERPDAQGREFGDGRVQSLAREIKDLSAVEAVDRTFRALDEFGEGTPQPDDITVVVVRRLEIPSAAMREEDNRKTQAAGIDDTGAGDPTA